MGFAAPARSERVQRGADVVSVPCVSCRLLHTTHLVLPHSRLLQRRGAGGKPPTPPPWPCWRPQPRPRAALAPCCRQGGSPGLGCQHGGRQHTHTARLGERESFGAGSASVAAAQTARPRVSECHLVCSRRAGVACSSRRRATGPLGLGGAVSGFLRPEQRPGWTCGAVEVQPQHIAIAAAAVPRPA